MGQVLDFIKGGFSRKGKESKGNAEELRVDFRARYHQFKLLLNANNKSLEIMADIERALRLGQPFGMSFVKATCTAISVNVFQMIKNLAELGPGKYKELSKRFNGIQQNIDQLLTERKEVKDERLIIPLSSIDKEMSDLVGSKMANLGEIKNKIEIQVPEGFSITSAAYQKFMEHNDLQSEIERRFQSADLENMERLYTLSAEIQQLIIRSRPPENLHEAIMNACRELEGVGGGEMRLAVRSSAMGEDTAGTSFAGQYRTELNVSSEEIIEAYKEVIASKYSLPAITYRLNRGFRDEDISMGVGCLVMIDAEAGGVIYSRNPVDLRNDSIFINSVWGLPESVVDGSVACDLFVVTKEKPIRVIQKEIKVKEKKSIRRSQDGVSRIDLPRDMGELPSIDEAQACILAELAIKMEEYYTLPQDIEWAIDPDGAIYILQCRPLQQMETAKISLPEDMIRPDKKDVVVRGGITASQGSACGPVYFADTGVDILRFPEGAVLVVQQALPKWASLLSRAAALVTEQGGFAGHLANVAREFGVPSLFGVKGVRDQLNSGEIITVDAGGLVIYKGKIDSLLVESDMEKNLMQGSPVYDTLKQVSRHIIPLNLLDPDSPDFKPTNCKTFHDITRFVHEKSVHEMFSFGKGHDFSERSSKQLFYKVPMQWWILNLDDGFNEEIEGKHVRLDNIASIPMLAFWNGFVAVPWDGPPAIDGKGFMSVVFRSTQNTALTPGVRSRYADRNYFMISKNYCNLNSRLGYHFSTMEALTSDRVNENYVGFQFKGGAADFDRRLKRTHFIKELLEKYDFRVEVREDNLIARVEHHEKEYMKERLQILGYLTLHTRQLDMIMANDSEVRYYKAKIEKDIRELLGV